MKTIISASRRTDIPAFNLDWLITCLRKKRAEVITPRGIPMTVDLSREKIHTLVLWSKNFRPFLDRHHEFDGYHLYFNFTINDSPLLEPAVPPLTERLNQAKELAQIYGAERVNWRFDPIVFWDTGKKHNAENFETILAAMARIKITRCTVSFCTLYASVVRRGKKYGVTFFDPPHEYKKAFLADMAQTAAAAGIHLYSCCCDTLTDIPNVQKASCIDGRLLAHLKGETASIAKDRGQRSECSCTKSIDIGSYTTACAHSCVYCYANPSMQ